MQKLIVENWRRAVHRNAGGVFKSFTQSLFIHLTNDPTTQPVRIHLGLQLGRDHLVALLDTLHEIGVNHVVINLKYGHRPAAEIVEKLREFIAPLIPAAELSGRAPL